MANIDNPRGLEWAGNLYGGTGGAQAMHGLVGAGQTIAAGDPVVIDGGQLDLAAADPTNVYGVAQGAGTAGDEIEFIPALPGYLWRIQCTTLANTDIGGTCAFVAATGEFEANTAVAGNGALHIVRLDDTDTPENDYGDDADAIVQIANTAWS